MSQGNHNALVLTIPNAETKFVDKLWKKYLAEVGAKTIRDRKTKEWRTEGAAVPGVGNNVNVYATTDAFGPDVEQIVWFGFDGTYLSSAMHGGNYLQGERFLLEFGLMVTREMIRLELEAEEKRMRDLETRMARLKRQNDGYHREIKIAEEKIETAKKNIVTNEQEQEQTANAIDDQRAALEAVKLRLREVQN